MAVNSKGQSGLGTIVSIGQPTGATLSTDWTPVSEITDFAFKFPDIKTAPSTHLLSTIETAKPVIQGLTKVSVKCTRVANDPGQLLINTARTPTSPGVWVPYDFKVQLPTNTAAGQTTIGDVWTFSAFVLGGDLGASPDKLVDLNFDLQYDSELTFTPGT
jgi:hypothetical protein